MAFLPLRCLTASLVALVIATAVSPAHAADSYVSATPTPGAFPIAQGPATATLYVDPADWPGVARAATDLQADIQRVTAQKPALAQDKSTLTGPVNEPRQGVENYATADALLAWCKTNHIAVRGHCLFYEGSGGQPAWLSSLSPDQLRAALQRRAADATAHFKGQFISWDGNNEMLHGTFFKDRLTDDIRVWMYQQAKQLDPATPLFTNDFNVLSTDQNFTQVQTGEYVAHVRDLIQRGAPIDGVGIQSHVWREKLWDHPELVRQRLDKVAALGLPIWLSEFDYANPDPAIRADVLELVYRTAFSHPAVHGIMLWVYWAGNNWRASKDGDAALFNRDWFINAEGQRFEQLMAEWTTHATLTTNAAGQARFRGFHGTYTAEIPGHPTQTFSLNPGPAPQPVPLIAK